MRASTSARRFGYGLLVSRGWPFEPPASDFPQHRHRDGSVVFFENIDNASIIPFVVRPLRLWWSGSRRLLANWSGVGILNPVDQMQERPVMRPLGVLRDRLDDDFATSIGGRVAEPASLNSCSLAPQRST